MTLGELIALLKTYDPNLRVPHGFAKPHSWRGDYAQLAFEPATDVTIGEMLACAKEALGSTYTGYKGGEYKMGEYSDVYLARYGELGQEIGPTLLYYMLNSTNREHDELVETLGLDANASWPQIVGAVRSLKDQANKKIVVSDIIGTLGRMELWSTVMEGIELQLSDEAVYQHLLTCVQVLDDEDQKRMLRDAAELFADEFCSGDRKGRR